MKKVFLLLTLFICLIGCSKIPNKSIEQTLSNNEISSWLKEDTLFISDYYVNFREWWGTLDQISQAKYSEVTYRRLYEFLKYSNDTTQWMPFEKQCKEEWQIKYGASIIKADSIIAYWDSLSRAHSEMMNGLVTIELKKIDTEYYEYIGGVKNVDIGFLITPMQGTIQQVRFEYEYAPKLTETKSVKHSCICTSPISSPAIKWWEVDYSERERFGGETANSFLRDYNMNIKITGVRKNNTNYNIDDISIPESVRSYLDAQEDEWSARYMSDFYKKEVILSMIQSDYVEEWKYCSNKRMERLAAYDKLCHDIFSNFIEYHFDKENQ